MAAVVATIALAVAPMLEAIDQIAERVPVHHHRHRPRPMSVWTLRTSQLSDEDSEHALRLIR